MLNFKQFKSETNGNVAMMFAVSTLMLVTGIGAAIDFSNLSRAKNTLQAQVDAGVLAAATVEIEKTNNGNGQGSNNQEKQTRETVAREVVEANGFDLTGISPVLTLNENSVILQAELDYIPFFGGVLGVDKIRLKAEAESGLPGVDSVDIALILDNTESMKVNGKLDALKAGAISLVDAIDGSGSGSKIALVPFSRYVRVPLSAASENWLSVPAEYDTPHTWEQATHTGGTCMDVTRTRDRDGIEETYVTEECTGQTTTYQIESGIHESRWEGCIGTRVPPFSEQDGSYTYKIPGLLNIVPKEVSGLNWDQKSYCPGEIEALTDDYEAIRNNINNLFTTDNTHIPSGLIWGQRVLSPGLPFDNVQTDGPKRQVMVLMTDGKNTTQINQSAGAAANLDAPPYIDSVNSDDIATVANATTARICTSLKAEGIEIFTIAFQVADAATNTLLKNCASAPENALTADSNVQLVERFEKIASVLKADIRLMR